MSKVISATDARIHLGEHLDAVENNDVIKVEHEGSVEAVLVSASEGEHLESSQHDPQEWRAAFADVRGLIREEIGDQTIDIDEIIHEMREERNVDSRELREESDPGEDWWQIAAQSREAFRRQLGEHPRPSAVELIREGRDEREAEAIDALR